MVKYVMTAVALKCFSSSQFARGIYRSLGNSVGNQRRSLGTIPSYYAERVKRMVRLQKQHQLLRDGDRILELGTGWLHWEAITLRLFYNIRAVLYDVWDNRQLDGLKNYLRQLKPILQTFDLSIDEVLRARSMIDEILRIQSFEQLYRMLDFEYIVDASGSIEQFADRAFQLVVSAGVLEHIKREALPKLVADMQRVLKPGGWGIHSIDTSDHLQHYDRSVSAKFYLSFSEKQWSRLYKNEVQYINRVQRGEWLELFKRNGFNLIEEEVRRVDLANVRLAPRFGKMARTDLECTVLKVTLIKPTM